MEQRKLYVETFQYAVEAAGSIAALARLLRVPPDSVRRWLSGEQPPLEAFLAALDVVAAGPGRIGVTRSVTQRQGREGKEPGAPRGRGPVRQL